MAINRAELVDQVAGKARAAKTDVNKILDGLFEVFAESVSSGEKITIPGWLAVERTDRAAARAVTRRPESRSKSQPAMQ